LAEIVPVGGTVKGMRRFAIMLVCIAAILWVAAMPALAQKNPFEPLITEGDTTTQPDGDTTTTDTTDTTTTTTTDTQPSEDEPLPNTGADPGRWIGLAALAISLGVGLLILARVIHPPALREARGR
jgi:LPXTG-motif cell wall-anchored protein